jgi:hypothetical protein
MSDKSLEQKLAAPFDVDDIEWRVQNAGLSGDGNPYCMVVPYITNRAIQKRLDDIFGVMGWSNTYKPTPDGKGYLCGLEVEHDGKKIQKWDGAEYTNIEALKGALSDAMKRCAVQFRVGRYLYGLTATFAKCHIVKSRKDAINCHVHYHDKRDKSKGHVLISWIAPELPEWAKPQEDYSKFIEPIKAAKDMVELKDAFADAYRASQVNQSKTLESMATKEKDAKKEELEKEFERRRREFISPIMSWLENEYLMFKDMSTTSILENYAQKVRNELKLKTGRSEFDVTPVFQKLEELIAKRKTEINQKQENKNDQ